MYKYILFDFDGTVFDTVEGITKSVQYALAKRGIAAELDSLRSLLVSIEVGDALHMNLCISGEAPLRHLKDPFPALEWEEDEDGLQYVLLRVEKSGGK